MPRREDAQQVTITEPVQNPQIVVTNFTSGAQQLEKATPIMRFVDDSLRQSDNIANPSFVARWNKNAFTELQRGAASPRTFSVVDPLTNTEIVLTWDARVCGRDWHTVFVFDGPRTYVIASIDYRSIIFSGMARCNPKDEYNRNTGMREAVRSMMLNYVGKWRNPYQRAFRVWINQFDPVWPKG